MFILLLFFNLSSYANTNLTPEQAFPLHVQADAQDIKVQWNIAPGYYLYQDRINFSAQGLQLGKAQLPLGKTKHDIVLGTYTVFDGLATISIPYFKKEADKAILYVGYQGCSEAGFCFPPQLKQVDFQFADNGTVKVSLQDYQLDNSIQDHFTHLLENSSKVWSLLLFLCAGILLTFTPCVLPMIPILSSIILGRKTLSTYKAALLACIYVLGMALTYAIAGVIAASIGASVQATLQLPWIIAVFAALFIVLAASMFGLYELRLPATLEHRLMQLSRRQSSGHYLGAFVMGILSSLIVSPCISAPLVGALAYISQTGNAVFGGLALFSLALGMGLPLIILATLGGRFLPRAGAWMVSVKHIAGFLLIALAIWTVQRILPGFYILALWGLLAVSLGIYCLWRNHRWPGILAAIVFVAYGVMALVGASQQHSDPLKPWAKALAKLQFIQVKTINDVDKIIATSAGKIVVLDFYADWCVACQLMEKQVFSDPSVHAALEDKVLLQADVTNNDKDDKALQQHYGVYAPPTIIVFDKQGKVATVIVGEISPSMLLEKLIMFG